MVNVPVLMITFARPDYARQVFEAVKRAKPKVLYFYSNIARKEYPDEVKRNQEIRSWIKEIDWQCDLHTYFRTDYVDLYTSVKGAMDWVFENEERAIVFEEDCVPTPAFFSFCEQMLNKFDDDKRVWCISGDNFLNINPSGYDYIFSHYHWMWGWASWADRWKKITWNDLRIEEFISSHISYQLYKTKEQALFREKEVKEIEAFVNETKCWDYAFGIIIDQYNGVTVHPTRHLITNVGVSGVNHSSGEKAIYNIESQVKDESYIIHKEPPFVFADLEYDYMLYSNLQKPRSLISRAYNKALRIMKNIIKTK